MSDVTSWVLGTYGPAPKAQHLQVVIVALCQPAVFESAFYFTCFMSDFQPETTSTGSIYSQFRVTVPVKYKFYVVYLRLVNK